MKKWIASVLAFCLILTLSAYGPTAEMAFAEVQTETPVPTAETPEMTVLVSVTAQPAEGAEETAPTVSTETTASVTAVTATPAATEDAASAEDETTNEPSVILDAPEGADATDTAEPATATPENTVTQTPDAATVPVITTVPAATAEANVGSGPVWVAEGAHRRYGQLNEILPIAIVTKQTLYFSSASVLELKGYSVSELRSVGFGLDQDALGKDFCQGKTIVISAISPSGAMRDGSLYLWVGRASDIPSASEALEDTVQLNDSDVLETEIEVKSAGYSADTACAPVFTLTAYPELSADQTFAVLFNGSEPQALSGNAFAPTQSGEYRFAVLDADGTLAARSAAFTVVYAGAEEETGTTAEPDAAAVSETPAVGPTQETAAGTASTAAPDNAEAASEPEAAGLTDATAQPEGTAEPGETTEEPAGATAQPEGAAESAEATEEPADTTALPEGIAEPAEATEEPADTTAQPEGTAEPGDTTVEPDAADTTGEPALAPDTTADPSALTQEDLAELAAGSPVLAEMPEISVRAYDYVEGTVSGVAPSFALSGAPVGGGYSYGIILNGQPVAPLTGSTYCITENGEYVFAFCLLDSDGVMADLSATYHVLMDAAGITVVGQAWMEVNDQKVYGTLASLVESAPDGTTIYLLTSDVIALSDTAKLSRVHLAPDPGIFEGGSYVIVSADSPEGE